MELPNNCISTFKNKFNKANQFIVAVLATLLILDVWLGVLDRYILKLQLVWVEELARYIMIWAILMAVPCCTAGREHMGLEFVVKRFSFITQQVIKCIVGLITLSFFAYICYLGITFAAKGSSQLSTVFGMPMAYAYAAIPTTFALSAFQSLLVWLEDVYALKLSLMQPELQVQGEV
ncbi:TRAP transporter small permease [Vibrio sp.]|nr:TRAP transporter small permease [Vibrio sp.]